MRSLGVDWCGEEGLNYVANGVVVTNYGMVLCVCVVAYVARM